GSSAVWVRRSRRRSKRPPIPLARSPRIRPVRQMPRRPHQDPRSPTRLLRHGADPEQAAAREAASANQVRYRELELMKPRLHLREREVDGEDGGAPTLAAPLPRQARHTGIRGQTELPSEPARGSREEGRLIRPSE